MPQYSYSSQSNQLTQINDGTQVRVIQSDANGSITDNATNRFDYDARGRLVSAQTFSGTAVNKINSLGQRISKITPAATTVFHYDQNGYLIGENTGTAGTDYIYLNGIPAAVGFSISESLFYIYSDQLATPRLITDNTGTPVWQWDGEPFGNSQPNENPSGAGIFKFNLRFPGQYYDAETNLNQNYFREYDPATGRYIQSDPLGFGGGQVSTYAYVNGNPITYTDPSGNIPVFLVTGAIGGIAGFVGNVGYQLFDNGGNFSCVKWGDAGIAAASGAVAGAMLPITGTTAIGAMVTGATTNIGGYAATQEANGNSITLNGVVVSGVAGAIGGGVAGKMSNPFWFAKDLSPWLSDQALTAANANALALGRAGAGAAIGSVSPGSSDCGCAK